MVSNVLALVIETVEISFSLSRMGSYELWRAPFFYFTKGSSEGGKCPKEEFMFFKSSRLPHVSSSVEESVSAQ